MRFLAASRASSRREISPRSSWLGPASRLSSTMRSSKSLIGRSNSRITARPSRQETQQPLQVSPEGQSVHDAVDHPMIPLKLRRLKALGQSLLGRLFDDPRSGEPDPGPRLGDNHVRGGGERGRHPPEHPRPARGRHYHERQPLSVGELHGPRDLLADDAPHRPTYKAKVEHRERDAPPPDGAGSAKHGVVEAGLPAGALQLLPVVIEAQRVLGEHAPVALPEAAAVGEEPHALGGGERVVELAVRTDVEAGPEVLLVDWLATPLALSEDRVYRADAALGLRRAPRVLPPFAQPVPDAYPPASTREASERASRTPRSHSPALSGPPSPTSRMSLLPMIIPSASAAASTAAPSDPIPKPSATGAVVFGRTRRSNLTAPGGRASRTPVTPATETQYTNPVASSPTRATRSSVEVGATSGQRATPAPAASSAKASISSTGRSGITSPDTPASAASRKNPSAPRARMTL